MTKQESARIVADMDQLGHDLAESLQAVVRILSGERRHRAINRVRSIIVNDLRNRGVSEQDIISIEHTIVEVFQSGIACQELHNRL